MFSGLRRAESVGGFAPRITCFPCLSFREVSSCVRKGLFFDTRVENFKRNQSVAKIERDTLKCVP